MTVTVLTPPGTGAIATVRVAGAGAWGTVRRAFKPAGKKRLPEAVELHRVWFGTLGDGGDEVVIGVERAEPEPVIDVHCHGGRRVVAWVVEVLAGGEHEGLASCESNGGLAPPARHESALSRSRPVQSDPAAFLPYAPTIRAASILLDQLHGAFDRGVCACLDDFTLTSRLALLAPIGRHLVEPWRVVLAGPPNVGKSSLINALAGFERSVVAPVAGTTRDVVTVRVALDGWPVELSDTAGLRDAGEALEAEGIARTKARLTDADLVVWVMDATAPVTPPDGFAGVVVANKADLCPVIPSLGEQTPLSALTGAGVPILISEIVRRLVPVAPTPGEAVPYTPELADSVEAANRALVTGNIDAARQFLRACLG